MKSTKTTIRPQDHIEDPHKTDHLWKLAKACSCTQLSTAPGRNLRTWFFLTLIIASLDDEGDEEDEGLHGVDDDEEEEDKGLGGAYNKSNDLSHCCFSSKMFLAYPESGQHLQKFENSQQSIS